MGNRQRNKFRSELQNVGFCSKDPGLSTCVCLWLVALCNGDKGAATLNMTCQHSSIP